MKSTMTILYEENARLRRASIMDRVIYWVCLAAVVIVSMFEKGVM